ncbi:D-glycero-beta-D-manno-heptose 1,7-bisphosphate 7-phosphatase [Thalassotalea maritima]|uniref:D-glycero-beta-D-manno-heptose 1,7-bisphosphate 7-phosphatase n=1 Tax=Thalassotalea maritima TaxID=3242416 RepID=UPI00352826CE
MKKALFLDRDGIINVDHGYVYKQEEFEFVDGIFELCQKALSRGYDIFVITNQSGIARGMYSEQQFADLTAWMKNKFADQGVTISDVYYCPHHPTKGNAPYVMSCDCRKPEPGMILKAVSEHNVDVSESMFIGDKLSDMLAAERAGVKDKVLVRSNYADEEVSVAEEFANIRSITERFF